MTIVTLRVTSCLRARLERLKTDAREVARQAKDEDFRVPEGAAENGEE